MICIECGRQLGDTRWFTYVWVPQTGVGTMSSIILCPGCIRGTSSVRVSVLKTGELYYREKTYHGTEEAATLAHITRQLSRDQHE